MGQAGQASSFVYVAAKPGGGRGMGVRQAEGVMQLSDELRREGRLLMRSWQLPAWAARDDELTLRDQSALNLQLSQLLSRGVPLVEAIEVAAGTVRAGAKLRVMKMRELVSAGTSFSDACKQVGGFDEVTVAVYRAAERTGDLAGAARQLHEAQRRQLEIGSKAVTVMIYPAIVMTISVLVVMVMLMWIVPMLWESLQDLDADLPWYSEVVFSLGQWMRGHMTWVLVGVGGFLTLVLVLKGLVWRGVQAGMRHVPMMKGLLLAQESARFFSVMAAMATNGVPLGDALAVGNRVVTHPKLRKQLERMRERLIGGGMLRVLIEEVTELPLATRKLLVAAEKSGDMDEVFGTLAEDMTEEVDRRSSRLLAALEPAVIVMMVAVIGSIVISIMMPMLTMSQNIQM